MKKIVSLIATVFALVTIGLMTSCVQNYNGAYPELTQYYCCWGDNVKWNDHGDVAKTLMTYDAASGVYSIEVTTERKNQRFEITKGAGYTIEYMFDAKGVCSADDETIANFPKAKDNGFGSLQTVMPTVGTYAITFDPVTEKYNLSEK